MKSKKFDWYGLRQHFSIRKYHYGAVSVLLGASLIIGGHQAKAEEVKTDTSQQIDLILETTNSSDIIQSPENSSEISEIESQSTVATSEISSLSTTLATSESDAISQISENESSSYKSEGANFTSETESSSNTSLSNFTASEAASQTEQTSASTSEAATKEVTVSEATTTVAKTSERTANIPYRVVYTDVETGQVFRPTQVAYETVQTDSVVAQKEIAVVADRIRTGYRLADGQSSTLTATIVENQKNILSFSIVKDNKKQTEVRAQNQVTALRNAGASDAISGVFVKGDETLYTGQVSEDELRLSVLGIDATYSNLTVQFEVYENGVQGQAKLIKLSGYNNTQPTYNTTTKTYSLPIGQLISGSKVVLPISFNATNGTTDQTTATVKMTVLGSDGQVLGSGEKTVVWNALSTATVESTLAQNTLGIATDNSAIVGVKDIDTGQVLVRSVRSYVMGLDQTTKDAISAITSQTSSSISSSGSLPTGTVVRVYFDKDNFEASTYGNSRLTEGTNQSGRIINMEEGYIEYPISNAGVLHEIEAGTKGFYLFYTGKDDAVPDTVLETKVLNTRTGQVYSTTTSTHTNSWSYDKSLIPTGALSVQTGIDTGYTTDYTTGTFTGINTSEIYYNTRLNSTNWGNGYLAESMPNIPEKALATYQDTNFNRPSKDLGIINIVDQLTVDVAKQVDEDQADYFTKYKVTVQDIDAMTYADNQEAVVYYVTKDGVRKDLGTLGLLGSKSGATVNPILIEDQVETVGIDFSTTSGSFYQNVEIIIAQLSDNTAYNPQDFVTTHDITDKKIDSAQPNDYRYLAHLIGRETAAEDAKITWKSSYAGYVQEVISLKPRLYYYGKDRNSLYVADKATFYGRMLQETGMKSDIPVNENAYVYVALQSALEVTGFRIPSTKLSKDVSTYQTEKVDINGESYTVYKIPFVDGVTSVNETEAGVYVDYTMTQEYFYGSPTETKTTNVYYGLAFDSLSNFVRSGGEDALDLDGDQDLGDTAGETSIIGVSGTIKGISPKALFVYDQSKYTGGYSFDTTGVEAGDTVSIKASIQNNTVGTNYSDMTVITVLSNSQDEIFDGSKSRGSQFTPTLTGPITAPTGWTVYYTTDEQDSNESGANLTGWTDVVDDYSKVTAIKLVSDPGVILKTGSMVSFEYGLTTPADARSGSSITTTTAIAVNGSTNFLEGYRSTVQIKKTYGSVLVAYVDINGNTIADTAIDSPDSTETWTPYDTADKRQSEITVGERVYRLVASGNYPVGTVGDDGNLISHADTSKTDGIEPTTGEVGVGAKTVTYVYQEVLGKVTVKYVDEDGNPISGLTEDNKTVADTVEDTPESSLGTPYTTTDHKPTTITTADGKLYRYKEIQTGSADETGTVTEGEKIVTYVYELVKGNVTVNYKTVDGTEISPSVSDERDTPVGQPYDTRDQIKETITTTDGKVYKRIPKAVEGAETGKVVEGTTEVTYYYELVKGDVIVNYETTDGTTLAPQVVDTNDGDTGSDYSTTDHKPEKIVVDTTGDVYYILPTGTELKTGSAPETGKVAPGVTEVTYLYQKAGHVKVNYILDDASATVLKDSVMDVENGKPGTSYSTSEDNKPLTITVADGKVYQLKEVQADSAAETGTVEAGKTLEVTYIYTEVLSDVVVEYYNTAGEVIATTVVDEDDKSVGTVYNTDEDNKPATITTDDGTVYYYKEVKDTSAPTTGKVAETTTTVQYVYEKAGNVVVNYIAEDGTVIASPVADETNVKPGSDYNTTDNKPTTITTEDGKTYELIPTATIGTEGGTVEAGKTTEVTYVYKEVKGSVVVNYISTTGEELQKPVVDTPETSTGTAYDTRDVKPTEITTADGKTYRLVPTLTVGNETGTVVPGVTQVTYVYEEVKGDVVVNYINTDGDVIASQVVDTKTTSTGTAYDTTDNKPTKITTEDGTVYYYKEVEANSASETGKVVEGTTQVTYVYEKAGNVVVNYTLADGTVLKDPVNDETNQAPGYAYDTTDNKPDAITTTDGKVYRLVPSATIGNETGDVESDTTIEVTYIYEEVLSDVVVEYYDTEGNVIASTVVDEDDKSVGTVYNTDEDNRPATITTAEGTVYYYKEVKDTSAPTTGKVAETTTTVQYVYEKAGNVVVNYIAEDGTVIANPVADETNAQSGTSYDTTDHKPTTITTEDGKTYELIPTATIGTEEGTVEAGKTTEVTYVYKEVKGSVVVNYVTTDGTVLQAPVTDTPETSTGTAYDTRDVKPTEITTADGKTYRLVPTLTVGNETGTVVPGVTQVTYVYEEVKGDVVVNYINTDGDVIASQVVDTKTTSTGIAYDTTDNKPTKITTEDGTVYYYKEVGANSASETGKVVEGTTAITYVYEPAGNIVVNYTLADGTVIKAPVNDETNQAPGYDYDTTDNKPDAITTTDGKVYRLVPSATIGNETGDVESDTTLEVTYIYEEVKSDVVVEYYNTDGEVIATTVVDEDDKSVGTVYNTDEDNRPATITTAEGTVYYYKEVKDTSAPTTGKVAETTTTVQYVYEKAGNVVVNYIAEDGTVIASPVADETNAQPGTAYNTTDNKPTTITTEDGTTYELVPSATIGTENGEVESGKTTEVTYVYRKVETPAAKTGNVVVEYYNIAGEKIATDVVDTPEITTGTVYETFDFKPSTITKDGVTYFYKEVKDTSAAEKGTVVEGTTTVQYVYEPAGSVTVNYVTTDGTVIKSPVKDEENAEPGQTYSTEDNKPTTITTEDGKTYKLVPNLTTGEENGTVTSGEDKQITYVYEEVKGSVVVNYIDTEGNVIKAPVTDTPSSSTGTAYDTTDNKPTTITTEDGTTYELVPVLTKGSETGKVVEGETVVTYVYRKVVAPTPDVKTGSVVIRYVEAGNESNVLKDPVLDENAVVTGTKYDTTDEGDKPAEIVKDGVRYVLVPSKTTAVDPNGNPVTETGEVAEGTTVVTYKYQKVANWIPQIPATPENPTPVNPVIPYPFDPTNPDKPIDPTTPYPGGEVPSIPHVPGYTPVDPKTNEPLKPVDPTDPSKGYVPPTPDETGDDTPIPYVQNGNVVVNYVTEDGTVIKTPVKDETDAPAGKSYDTTDNKPAEIVTEDGSRYVLIPSKTVGSETGTVEGGKTTEITYVYKKVANWIPRIPVTPENPTPVNPVVPYPFDPTNPDKPIDPTTPYPDGEVPSIPHVPGYTPVDPKTNEPLKPVDPTDPSKGYVPPTPDESGIDTPIPYVQNGNVVVNYVTEDGTVIKAPVQDETDAPAGKSYDTTDNKPAEIVTEDGSRYVLIPSKTVGSETGTVEGGNTTEVTYVYSKVETPAKKVVTNHVDEVGNPIAPQEEGTTPNKSIPRYEFTGKTVTDADGNTTHIYRKVTVVAPTPDVKTGSVVIRYVESGNESNVLKDPVLDEDAVVTGTKYDTTDEGDKPAEIVKDGVRYVLIPSKTVGSETGTVEGGKTTEITYVYKKVANWIPQIPVTPENPTPVNPVVPYPFDPANPDKPIDPTTPYPDGEVPSIPHVPGYTPVDPKTNEPLKPVDPTNPSKGYVPPMPDESGTDTPIPYVQNGNVMVNYVTEDGIVIKVPVQDETDAPAGKSYDTTDNKLNTITTEDGTTYELVRVEGSETGTVVGGKTTEVTYVYRKVEIPAKKIVTNHVDEAGNAIAPQEEGTTPNKSIPGYEFTGKTVTDEDGNTTHIYRKVTKVVTNHVDEAGNPIAPQEEGTTPNKGTSIPGYEFTGKTITDENGNTTHIYRKVVTPVDPTAPVTPEDPTDPVTPVTPVDPKAPVQPDVTVRSETPAKIAYAAETLPKTGEDNSAAVTAMGVSMILASLGLATKRRR